MSEISIARQRLEKRGEDLTKRIIQVAQNVYTAVNYTVSTVSMIIGENGIVLIDAGQEPSDCAEIYAEFRKITDKTLLGIIYTHGHPDHTMGVRAFLENNANDVQIWARSNFNAENKQFAMLAPIFGKRGSMQGGFLLAPEQRINNGIAPVRFPKEGSFNAKAEVVAPTHVFSEEHKSIEIDSIQLDLYAAPGETADQLFVMYAKHNILFSGDNIYRSFPNLYAIRGAGYRDVRQWIASIDKMITLNPEKVVFGHTLPALTRNESATIMKDYRDAIEYVYNKSIEGMNNGLTLQEIGEYVQLPQELAEKDYLGEFYGNVAWSAKNIYTGHLGWFDGNARQLMPLTLEEEAQRMAELAGGEDELIAQARKALKTKKVEDAKWAAQLLDYCLYLGFQVEEMKAEALEIMAEELMTATGRNYMLSQALQLRTKAKQK